MTIPDDVAGPARPVQVPPDVYRGALRTVGPVGRVLRMDPPPWQGTSTEWFTQSAFRAGDLGHAHDYADYERAEYRVIYDSVLTGWLADVVEYVSEAPWSLGQAMDRLLRMPREELWPRFERLADVALVVLHRTIDLGDEDSFEASQASLREVHTASNDLCVRWIQDLFTSLADHEGEEAVERVMQVSYERIWKNRYDAWFRLDPHERLALSSEGMRAHYGGPGRRGDFEVTETDDAYVMAFDPCGTGGVLRRENDLRDGAYFDDDRGVNVTEQPWSWGLTGVPWYCAHCPMLMEMFPLRDRGTVIRPVEFDPDPWGQTRWLVPKQIDASGRGPVRA